ncbi:hypothetical protein [Synechococcus sp. MIT S1220]|uniref:hypothetical protein n=1 Tax=Synechococcus sp. MIT S1220 TaxID=3082549 RepID=UPI0039B06FCB
MSQSETGGHCGSKPKRLAIGIAPLGTVSIGIVPMGVICIGIVPMGVISIGVVAMGVITGSIVGMGLFSVGVNTMGVITAGPMSMGLIQLEGTDRRYLAYPTREEAIKQAEALGCKGAHQMGSYWMPCEEHP